MREGRGTGRSRLFANGCLWRQETTNPKTNTTAEALQEVGWGYVSAAKQAERRKYD